MATVTFDVWHTLLYLSPEDEDAYYRIQVALGARALRGAPPTPGAPELSEQELGQVFERVLREAMAEAGRGRTVTPARQIVQAAERVGRTVRTDEYLERLSAAVAERPFKSAPGADELLESLQDDGDRIGIVGNTVGEPGAALQEVLRRRGLAQYFDVFVFSDEHPWAKPAPEIFWEAIRRLGGAPERTIHVGDAWSDIEGARRAKLRGSILFTGLQDYGTNYRALNILSREERLPTDYVAEKMSEVRPIIRGLLPIR